MLHKLSDYVLVGAAVVGPVAGALFPFTAYYITQRMKTPKSPQQRIEPQLPLKNLRAHQPS